jgi:hypothetical protein
MNKAAAINVEKTRKQMLTFFESSFTEHPQDYGIDDFSPF